MKVRALLQKDMLKEHIRNPVVELNKTLADAKGHQGQQTAKVRRPGGVGVRRVKDITG
jgi:hypothetical protein